MVFSVAALLCLLWSPGADCSQEVRVKTNAIGPAGGDIAWTGNTARDLHAEYRNIFRRGNRNAASHLWAAFIIDRAGHMSNQRFEELFQGFCAVSGSPVRASPYTTYLMRIESVTGGEVEGYTYYCCWPCVCDTEDYIKVDTRTVRTADGLVQYHWLVIGNPCASPEKIPWQAPEVTCTADGNLEGAILSDHGYVILTLFPLASKHGEGSAITYDSGYQRQEDYADHCISRAQAGYNSGMGEIFREVAGISPIIPDNQLALDGPPSCDSHLTASIDNTPPQD